MLTGQETCHEWRKRKISIHLFTSLHFDSIHFDSLYFDSLYFDSLHVFPPYTQFTYRFHLFNLIHLFTYDYSLKRRPDAGKSSEYQQLISIKSQTNIYSLYFTYSLQLNYSQKLQIWPVGLYRITKKCIYFTALIHFIPHIHFNWHHSFTSRHSVNSLHLFILHIHFNSLIHFTYSPHYIHSLHLTYSFCCIHSIHFTYSLHLITSVITLAINLTY